MNQSSETIDGGGTAFPCDEYTKDGNHFRCHTGMSMLDYFAGQSLPKMIELSQRWLLKDESLGPDAVLGQIVAAQSYAIALDMLNERERINAGK